MTGAAHGIPRHVRGPMLLRQAKDNPKAIFAYLRTLDPGREESFLEKAEDLVPLILDLEYDHD